MQRSPLLGGSLRRDDGKRFSTWYAHCFSMWNVRVTGLLY